MSTKVHHIAKSTSFSTLLVIPKPATKVSVTTMSRRTLLRKDTEIKNAKPHNKEYNLANGNGLSLRIKPIVTKAWIFNYYHPLTKKRTNLDLGNAPGVTLAQARQSRDEARKLLAQDIDQPEQKELNRAQQKAELDNTFQKVARDWRDVKRPEIIENQAKSTWNSLALHIFP